MVFRVAPMRFTFEARDALRFGPFEAGNTFRGALGAMLQRVAPPETYRRIFEPRAEPRSEPRSEHAAPSGFRNLPRPFVLRAAGTDGGPQGRGVEPGEPFTVDVNGFDVELPIFELFSLAFAHLEREGLGPRRSRVALRDAAAGPTVTMDLAPDPAAPVHTLRVEFLTPTELKHAGETVREPRFDVLFGRARDRIGSLAALYQGGAPAVDYARLGEQSKGVALRASNISQVDVTRRSSRTGQRHSLGGFVGYAEYRGELTALAPWLRAAQFTGVGRFTVWGNGAIAVSEIS